VAADWDGTGGTGAAGDGRPGDGPGIGGRAPAEGADERALAEGFDRLAPQDSIRWNFDDAMRRLSTPGEWTEAIEPWHGLPADLWERGRSTRASERVLGDVVKIVAQELTEYTQRLVDGTRRSVADSTAVWDALRFLNARVEQLEAASDPLGIRPAELDLPDPDLSPWADRVAGWCDDGAGPPVTVGELGDRSVVDALARAGRAVDGVDPRGPVVWAVGDDRTAGGVSVALADVVTHLGALEPGSRSGVVLSGSVDRVHLEDKVTLIDAAVRALTPGGTLVLFATDQAAWDGMLDPQLRDLLPGRPLHPETWTMLLDRRGLVGAEWHPAGNGTVHAVVARRPR
jgi:hypothetical protein